MIFRVPESLELTECISILVGITLGSGIFMGNDVFNHTGSVTASFLIWLLSGTLNAMGAWTLVELGCAFPRYGGDYIYLYEAFGPLIGFLHLWSTIVIVLPCSSGIYISTFTYNIVNTILPAECSKWNLTVNKLLSTVAVLLVTYLHCLNVKFTTRLQNAFMYIKLTMVILMIIGGLIWMMREGMDNLSNWTYHKRSVKSWSYAINYGLFSFTGWNSLNVLIEEIKDPMETFPKAMTIMVPILFACYLLINLCYVTTLGLEGVSKSKMISMDFAAKALNQLKPWAMPAMVGVSIFGTLSVNTMITSRLFIAGARNGHLPEVLHHINLFRLTPIPSIIFAMTTAFILALSGADVSALVTYRTMVSSIFSLCSVSACIVLKYRRPELKRPIEVPLAIPFVYVTVYSIILTGILALRPLPLLVSAAAISSGIPVYYLFIKRRPKALSQFMSKFTQIIQKLLLTAAQEDEDDVRIFSTVVDKRTAHQKSLILKKKSISARSFRKENP